MKTYAAYYDNTIREHSSSGGLFSVIASEFDVVYGVTMTTDCYKAHMVRTENDITNFRGSKYLQAKLGDSYKQVKKDLQEGLRVLFTGTGCQINGLICFLGDTYDNLLCVDVLCHGVPSPKLWKKYIDSIESRNGKVTSALFRYKNNDNVDIKTKDNQLYISKDKDKYMRFFLSNLSLRPSCYKCHAKKTKLADITLGDFWGIESVAPELDDGRGVSIVIVRTDKGEDFFDRVKNKLKWKEVEYESAIKQNPVEFQSVDCPENRSMFFKDMQWISFNKLAKKYINLSIWIRIKRRIKGILKGERRKEERVSKDNYGMLFTFKKHDEKVEFK